MIGFVAVVGLTVLSCLAVGALGGWLLHRLRESSLRYQVLVAALLPVLAVAITVVINVRLMFLSEHDTVVVLVALTTAVVLAVVGALLVTRRILSGFHRLGAEVGRLGSAEEAGPSDDADLRLPAELNAVRADLADARRRLAEARERERAAEESRRELVTFMSHDLRTPLAALRALAEGLEDDVIPDVPRALTQLRSTVDRMDGLVDDLFELSRLGGPAAVKQHRMVSLAEVVHDVGGEAAAGAAVRQVELWVETPDEDRLAVLGSHDDLTRAVANLVANAVRFTPDGGTVMLAAEREPAGTITVLVNDQCGGIPADHLDRVFDAGWRGNPERGGAGGAGLGLAIARGVALAHSGSIAVRNTADGCRFALTLPGAER